MEKGFTLIELMIVVALIAIISVIAMITFGDQLKKSKDANVLKVLVALRGSVANGINHDSNSSDVYFNKVSEIKKYLSPAILRNIELADDTTAEDDFWTSYQMKAGKVEKAGGISSIGTIGNLSSEMNVVEIYYDNREGRLYIDGVGAGLYDYNTKIFYDTNNKYWKDY